MGPRLSLSWKSTSKNPKRTDSRGAMGVECITIQRVAVKRNMPQRDPWGSLTFRVQAEEIWSQKEPDTTQPWM